ncbi:hypothetical protein VC83_00902 [Pseudogymnoascus destructans]|uniref:Protein kinase domain-containing protein n=1 Tax=Pseudogymnoascus destructans TaxID=655981 RepID=A0A177AMU1_9PEZI|nr:uncharacterized protein VC83_00902 [Pseudogymnoascus destructans]OAF62593.1 hypothetical protein VC83_00902 [Pseudogymnoascus destructans]
MSWKGGSGDTQWPELNQGDFKTISTTCLENHHRMTQVPRQTAFPGNFDVIKLKSLGLLEIPRVERERRDASKYIPQKLQLEMTTMDSERQTKVPQKRPLINYWVKDPWDTYSSLRTLDRGGIVTAACTRKAPVQMVVIKELRSVLCTTELKWTFHHNLLAFLEMYQIEEKMLAVMEYTVATLQQVMAVPLPLEEIHISALFEGIWHLSKNGVVHSNLNTSKVLFTLDGCVKIAFLDDYEASALTHTRPLGVIAIEMMQNGIPPGPGNSLILRHPDLWSAQAAKFLSVASWGSLQDLKNVRHPGSVTGLC